MSVPVLTPCPGTVTAMADLPDPVFSAGLVGPGVALDPAGGLQEATCPVAGTLLKIHPHAFVVVDTAGHGILVHLGINTVEMEGEGFTVLCDEGATVNAGTAVVRWNPSAVIDSGRSAAVIVVALDAKPASLSDLAAPGQAVAAGQRLFTLA